MKRGFTLIELVLVLGIMGLLVSAVGLNFKAVSAYQHRTETRALARRIRTARSTAVATRSTVSVSFREDGYTVQGQGPYRLPQGMHLTSNVSEDLQFNKYGIPSIEGKARTLTITYQGQSIVITIAPVTGKVTTKL
ncbi:prepilin-type N-terminal cleavage/methylation domain-containing protein [Peptoniphilus equinus]|uniref:Prepilin-type N-terminal cleavage/methylation domain-containing protein n=1 Tax=Peptoniphilus equinus TaxID=3016343 RepID=A0ABY7QW21_9FIRM|nr:prepilin-type N-terminal cleavage/methylation domain-containing protein [Peptoniphilus equinus]WBW50566.1 prepilin-type N-terminal cleavage/methylation domain-containing protein [Peptoniphilus equinus]